MHIRLQATGPVVTNEPEEGPLERFLRWADRQHQRAQLAALEDERLADLGLTRAEVDAEARRHD